MTRKVEVQLLDDIDGAPADETLTFGLDGSVYEIDLTAKRAGKLRTDLARYVTAARRTGRPGGLSVRRSGQAARNDRAQNQAIRDWAKRKKMQLSERGRIPRSIVEQYEAEAGR